MSRSAAFAIGLGLLIAVTCQPAIAQCAAAWTDTLGGIGTEGPVDALAVFDDGAGPALFAGGRFTKAGGATANSIARWWGGKWSVVGGGVGPTTFPFPTPNVAAMTVYDDGTGPALYVGGTFSMAGPVSAANIARWNGTSWAPLGSGIGAPFPGPPSQVSAMIVFDDGSGPKLHVGGQFATAGGLPAASIAKWDGTSWSTFPFGFTQVNAFAVFDDGSGPSLYVAGSVTAGPTTLYGLARWTGTGWVAVGGPMSGSVLALSVFDDGSGSRLYAGGLFSLANGVAVSNVAKWNGSQWAAGGSGVNGTVRAFRVFDDGTGPTLYAGGQFTIAGASGPGTSIAKLSGTAWSEVGGGLGGGLTSINAVEALQLPTPMLVAAGAFPAGFSTPGGGAVPLNNVASWSASSWGPLGGGLNDPVVAMTTFDDGSGSALHASGTFTDQTGVHSVARRTLTGWAPLGAAFSSPPSVLRSFDSGSGAQLYAGGTFTSAGGVPASNIAKWNGTSWSPLGSGLNGAVAALRVFDDGTGPALFVAGWFTIAGGTPANYVAKWNGASWSPPGSGTGGPATALEVFDDGTGPALYAGGYATPSFGSLPAVSRWNGATWSQFGTALGSGYFGSSLLALAVHDFGAGPRLVAGGNLSPVGGLSSAAVQWTGTTWTAITPPGAGGSAVGRAFATFDDGSGPTLYMATGSNGAMSFPFPALWRLSSSGWSPFGLTPVFIPGPMPIGAALEVSDAGSGPMLWVGGTFSHAGGLPSSNIGRFGPQRSIVVMTQPAGAGTGVVVTDYDLIPGNEYFNVFSPDVCPGPPGSGPYLGLCSNDLNFLISQVLLPIGTAPFHFIASNPTQAFGPFAVPAGLSIDALSTDFTGGTLHCVSQVNRITVQ